MYGISYTVGIFVEIYALERDAQFTVGVAHSTLSLLLVSILSPPWEPPPRAADCL